MTDYDETRTGRAVGVQGPGARLFFWEGARGPVAGSGEKAENRGPDLHFFQKNDRGIELTTTRFGSGLLTNEPNRQKSYKNFKLYKPNKNQKKAVYLQWGSGGPWSPGGRGPGARGH